MGVPTVIFIDTSILDEQSYNFSSRAVSAFLEAAKDHELTLLLPDPTRREIDRHIDNRSEQVIKALEEAERRAPFVSKWKDWPFKRRDLRLSFELCRIAHEEWRGFVSHFKVENLGYDGLSLEEVMNWYDRRQPPFGEKKKRKEFPDAFAVAGLLGYAKKNGVSVAVVSKDRDFEAACALYSELLYFRSLPALTEALLSGDKRVAEVKELIKSAPILIEQKIREEFADRGFRHEDDYEADIEDIEVDDVNISDVRIIHFGENEVTIAFEAKVGYSAYVRMDDHSTASIDSSEDWYMVWQEYRGNVQDYTDISGIAKCSMSGDWKMVENVLTFEIQQDHVTVMEWPEEAHWKGEE